MPVLFDDELHVHYGQFYVESRVDDFFEDLTESRAGQNNGLCGAAVPGFLFLTTGLHTGNVRLTVEVLDAPVPVGAEWEEVVEVSFRPVTEKVLLVQWAGERTWPLPLDRIDYRVRYCATGMDDGRQQDTRMDGEPLRDRYLVQLWPAPAALDTVVRETSKSAAYWHECARTSPTPEQLAEVKRQKQLAKEEAAREATRAAEERRWSGPPPSERLRRTNGASIMAGLARDLIDRMDNADAATQRAVAIWAAHQACAMAGLSDLDWVAAALAALDRGEPPFASVDQAFELLRNDSRVRFTTIRSYDGRHDRVSRQYMALPAVWAAAADDPLAAGMEALFHAVVTAGSEYPDLVAEARRAFIPR